MRRSVTLTYGSTGTALVCFARDHHFGGLDDGKGRLATFQLQFIDGVARDHSRQPLVANTQPDLGEQSFDAYLFNNPAELVPSADGDEDTRGMFGPPREGRDAPLRRQEALDFGFGNAMMTAIGADGSHRAFVDPLLEGRVADAQLGGGGADREQRHLRTPGGVEDLGCLQAAHPTPGRGRRGQIQDRNKQ